MQANFFRLALAGTAKNSGLTRFFHRPKLFHFCSALLRFHPDRDCELLAGGRGEAAYPRIRKKNPRP